MNLSLIPDILHLIKGHDFAGVLQFLQTSGYGIMFLLMLIEGPIVTYVAAFAVSLGIFNIFYVFILSSLGNFIGDVVLFFIGRVSKKKNIERYESRSLTPTKMSRLKNYLEKNPGKTLAVIKFTPFLPIPGLLLAGSSDMELRKFLGFSFIFSMSSALTMMILGFYSGVAFLTIAKYVKYMEYLIPLTILLIVFVFWLVKFVSRKISNRLEKI